MMWTTIAKIPLLLQVFAHWPYGSQLSQLSQRWEFKCGKLFTVTEVAMAVKWGDATICSKFTIYFIHFIQRKILLCRHISISESKEKEILRIWEKKKNWTDKTPNTITFFFCQWLFFAYGLYEQCLLLHGNQWT